MRVSWKILVNLFIIGVGYLFFAIHCFGWIIFWYPATVIFSVIHNSFLHTTENVVPTLLFASRFNLHMA
jgi:hypothetical protein